MANEGNNPRPHGFDLFGLDDETLGGGFGSSAGGGCSGGVGSSATHAMQNLNLNSVGNDWSYPDVYNYAAVIEQDLDDDVELPPVRMRRGAASRRNLGFRPPRAVGDGSDSMGTPPSGGFVMPSPPPSSGGVRMPGSARRRGATGRTRGRRSDNAHWNQIDFQQQQPSQHVEPSADLD